MIGSFLGRFEVRHPFKNTRAPDGLAALFMDREVRHPFKNTRAPDYLTHQKPP